jgi:sigma-B regulation protein RsbU (phosphoserine phosphatase)
MRGSRILVVDDEPGILRAIERVLGATHHIVVNSSARDSMAVAAAIDPELAILDVRMPELDGFELMGRLKAQHRELEIILMTGSVDDLDEKLIRAIRSHAFYFIQKPFDREVLKTLVERCLELRRSREENRRHVERLESELCEAHTFQQRLLPDREAVVNGLAICCRYAPCSTLGGDLFDYAEARSGQTALLIADVSGHGVSAAMLTGIVKSSFRSSEAEGYDPLAVVQRVWTSLAPFGYDRFVTLVAALVAADAGRLEYVNAGHPPGILWRRRDGFLWLEGTGPLVSPALRAPQWELKAAPIAEGDQILLYTDGVSEALATDDHGGEFRLSAAIGRHAEGGAALLDTILADVHRTASHPQSDDLTLVTARVLHRTEGDRPD